MGVYNVSKHAVVALSETLYQDLRLVTDQIGASVLCPFFVPTGITASERNRPDALKAAARPTQSQLIGQAMNEQAVGRGKLSAADVAGFVFDGDGRRPLLHLQPPAARWPACRPVSRTSCRAATRATRSRPGRRSAPSFAGRCAPRTEASWSRALSSRA